MFLFIRFCQPTYMKLTDNDLRQIDEAYLRSLSREQLETVSERLLADLKEARERLNQNPSNSSRPPSSRAPWIEAGLDEGEAEGEAEDEADARSAAQ